MGWGKYYSSAFCRKTSVILTEKHKLFLQNTTCITVLPKHMQQIHVHIAHLYLEMKSDIAFVPDAEGFLNCFSATKICRYSYPVSFSWVTLKTVVPWKYFHAHLHSKQTHLCPSSGKGWGEGSEGWYDSCPANTQQGNTNKISSPLNSLKRKSTFLWQSTL